MAWFVFNQFTTGFMAAVYSKTGKPDGDEIKYLAPADGTGAGYQRFYPAPTPKSIGEGVYLFFNYPEGPVAIPILYEMVQHLVPAHDGIPESGVNTLYYAGAQVRYWGIETAAEDNQPCVYISVEPRVPVDPTDNWNPTWKTDC
jgi:hypothetical protein